MHSPIIRTEAFRAQAREPISAIFNWFYAKGFVKERPKDLVKAQKVSLLSWVPSLIGCGLCLKGCGLREVWFWWHHLYWIKHFLWAGPTVWVVKLQHIWRGRSLLKFFSILCDELTFSRAFTYVNSTLWNDVTLCPLYWHLQTHRTNYAWKIQLLHYLV